MNSTPAQFRQLVLAQSRALGFDLIGVAAVAEFPRLRHMAAWLAAGRAGTMRYLARTRPDAPEGGSSAPVYLREDVRHSYPWAVSAVCLGLVYNAPLPRSTAVAGTPGRGWISRYAWGDDYHELLRARLERLREALAAAAPPEARFQLAVDTAPIPERELAAQAGLGWQGKNTCLIHPRAGSYYFLASLLTSLAIEPDSPLPDRCGSCRRCIDACPTGALDQPYVMDASRCIAYLNIELRGPIPEQLRAPMGENVFGCDICQDVCPWNRRAPVSLEPALQPRPGLFHPDLEELAGWDESAYREKLRGSAMKRAKYSALRRNLAVAMGNSGDPRHRATLERWAADADELVREHAQWALERLNRDKSAAAPTAPPQTPAP